MTKIKCKYSQNKCFHKNTVFGQLEHKEKETFGYSYPDISININLLKYKCMLYRYKLIFKYAGGAVNFY